MHRLSWLLRSLTLAGLALFALGTTAYAQQTGSTLQAITSRGTLRVGWTVFYPASFRDPASKEVKGYAVDLFNDLAKSLGVKLEFIEDSAATMPAGLQAKKFDITIPLGITLPRLQALTYSRPFLKGPAELAVRADDVKKFASWKDLDKPEFTVSTTLGSNIDLFVTQAFTKAKIIRVKNQTDSVAQVIAGRADAWANSSSAIVDVVGKRSELAILPNSEFGSSPTALPIMLGDFIFAAYLNEFLRIEEDTGRLTEIMSQYGLAGDIIH